ncbi:MAG: hypothetical protein AAFQ75_00095 [Pseudomonadota bacterium]
MPRRFGIMAGALGTAIILLFATTGFAATEAASATSFATVGTDGTALEEEQLPALGEAALPAALPLFALGFAALLFYRMRWR